MELIFVRCGVRSIHGNCERILWTNKRSAASIKFRDLLKKMEHIFSFKDITMRDSLWVSPKKLGKAQYYQISKQVLYARKFYIRRNNSKADSIETGCIVTAHLLP